MRSRLNLKRYILRSDRKLKAYEKRYTKIIAKALREQAEHAAKNNFELIDNLTPIIERLYTKVGVDVYMSQYRLLNDTIEKSIFLNTFKVWLKSYLQAEIGERVRNINRTTLDKIKRVIEMGFESRLTFEMTIDELMRIGAFSRERARMITRTEIGNINNEAKDRSSEDWRKETGNELYKIWIHRGAKKPRDWHVALDNGKAIPKEQPFIVSAPTGTTDSMQRPHDRSASPENVINCGCEVLYISKQYAINRKLI